MSATLHDVCKQAGVSTATVSRVINHSPLVTEETRTRVTEAMRLLGYRPSHAARTLARKRSDLLGVIFPGIASGFFTEVLGGIDEVSAEHKFHLTTCFSHGRADEERLVTRMVQERRADALLLMNLDQSDDFIKDAARQGTPIILIDRPVDAPKLCSISMDNDSGAEAATKHLLDHSYKRIAILTGPEDNFDAAHRLEGYQRALRAAEVSANSELVWQGAFTEESGREAMQHWLDDGNALPDAIFAANDVMALGALDVLRERGYRVPEDVALAGFDDIESARHLGLTSVRVPMRDMGRAAAQAAIKQILSREVQPSRILPTSLVVRRSCGCGSKNNNQGVYQHEDSNHHTVPDAGSDRLALHRDDDRARQSPAEREHRERHEQHAN